VSCDDVYILVSPHVKLRMGACVMRVIGCGSAMCLRMPAWQLSEVGVG
jgi:hypothetical protein